MIRVKRKAKCKDHYSLTDQPNFFEVISQRAGYLKNMPASTRRVRMPAVGPVGAAKPAGAKLLKGFNRSGLRAKHVTAVQHPCYGRRSERAHV